MRDFLLFRLYGPMASWGDIALGDERPTYGLPSRSGILGMLAAARGIARDDREELARLRDALSVGVCIERPGRLMTDYHTTQVAGHEDARDLHTRTDELSWPVNTTTVISPREYLCDAVFTVGVWNERDEVVDLSELAKALARPRWHLYLGRKSCPPALPMKPEVLASETFHEALASCVRYEGDPLAWLFRGRARRSLRVAWEGAHGGFQMEDRASRRDDPGDRTRWQFFEREEFRGRWHLDEEE